MTDREKVIKAVETCFDSWIDKHRNMGLDLQAVEQMKRDALELLKEQEPMTVRHTVSTERCPKCGKQITSRGAIHREIKFCWKCGQAVKWE